MQDLATALNKVQTRVCSAKQRTMIRSLSFTAALVLASCSSGSFDAGAIPYTLYRNSPIDSGLRIHWASFDARESDTNYNSNNCTISARVLNANFAASAKTDGQDSSPGVGFWCEPGRYAKSGAVQSRFERALPADVQEMAGEPVADRGGQLVPERRRVKIVSDCTARGLRYNDMETRCHRSSAKLESRGSQPSSDPCLGGAAFVTAAACQL